MNSVEVLTEHFSQLQDSRVERNKQYPLMEILLVAISGILSGAEG
ncbi:transposase family protein [Thiorhodococcus mannitoliphagus]|uniref:Transposase family protein n=1 Tax=Thiorhodococcus mannitoliphagus TaxID=329406 RepID=A0A6P1DU24_9GAMM|nr:transposase family protein [Thiorhodococcus mannitoliphagus]